MFTCEVTQPSLLQTECASPG